VFCVVVGVATVLFALGAFVLLLANVAVDGDDPVALVVGAAS